MLKKENEILDQRQNLITAQKENLKLKSDREKLSKICAELRKEINRLENNIKNLQKESLEDDEENLKNNDELLYYETPQIMSQNLVPNAMFNSNFYQKDSDNVDEDKIKFYFANSIKLY